MTFTRTTESKMKLKKIFSVLSLAVLIVSFQNCSNAKFSSSSASSKASGLGAATFDDGSGTVPATGGCNCTPGNTQGSTNGSNGSTIDLGTLPGIPGNLPIELPSGG